MCGYNIKEALTIDTTVREENKDLHKEFMKVEPDAYVPQLRREREKAAICFRAMLYANTLTCLDFLTQWHNRWAKDFKNCDYRNLRQQIKNGQLNDDTSDTWQQRYSFYLNTFGMYTPYKLKQIILSCKEKGEFPEDFRKRCKKLKLHIETANSMQRLGGYKLWQRYIDKTGRKRRKTIAGWYYDLSTDELVSLVDEMTITQNNEQEELST